MPTFEFCKFQTILVLGVLYPLHWDSKTYLSVSELGGHRLMVQTSREWLLGQQRVIQDIIDASLDHFHTVCWPICSVSFPDELIYLSYIPRAV